MTSGILAHHTLLYQPGGEKGGEGTQVRSCAWKVSATHPGTETPSNTVLSIDSEACWPLSCPISINACTWGYQLGQYYMCIYVCGLRSSFCASACSMIMSQFCSYSICFLAGAPIRQLDTCMSPKTTTQSVKSNPYCYAGQTCRGSSLMCGLVQLTPNQRGFPVRPCPKRLHAAAGQAPGCPMVSPKP